jgi:tetratricopeptide (TPR) repeat protein
VLWKLASGDHGLVAQAGLVLPLLAVLAGLGLVVLMGLLGLPWLRARRLGAPAPLSWILGMRLRRVPPMLIIRAWAELRQAGVNCRFSAVEQLYHENRHLIQNAHHLVECAMIRLPLMKGVMLEAPVSEVKPAAGESAAQLVERAHHLEHFTVHNPAMVAEVLDCYNRALQADPSYVAAYVGRADAYRYQKEYGRAIEDYTQAIRLDPQSAQAYRQRAMAHEASNHLEAAQADFDEAIRLDPQNAESYSLRGHFFNNRDRFEEALADYNEAVRLKPDEAFYRGERGLVLMELQRYPEAIADFTEELRLAGPSAITLECRGEAYLKNGQFDLAVQDLSAAIQLEPDRPEAYELRAEVYRRLGEMLRAIRDDMRAAELKKKPDGGREALGPGP